MDLDDKFHAAANLNPSKPKRCKSACCVVGCKKYARKGLSLHTFPNNIKLRKMWEVALRMEKPSTKFIRVCSDHFKREDYFPCFPGSTKRAHLKKNAVPSQNLPLRSHDRIDTPKQQKQKIDRANRASYRGVTASCSTRLTEVDMPDVEVILKEGDSMEEETVKPIGQENTPLTLDHDSLPISTKIVKQENVSLTSDSDSLPISTAKPQRRSAEVQCHTRVIQMILSNETNLNVYTGLHSFKILDGIVKCVSDVDRESTTNKRLLNLRDRVTLAFVKLKLNLEFSAIAPLFGVSRFACARYFKEIVPKLAQVLQVAIPEPSEQDLRGNMPVTVINFKNTKVVTDCAETPVESSECLKCRLMIYSQDKKGNMVNFKIGMAPSGLITSISRCYRGGISDKVITLKSHILDVLSFDDTFTDKGFFIVNESLERSLLVHQPPSQIKKEGSSRENTLSVVDKAQERLEAQRARVQIERVIMKIREFNFIGTKVTWSLLSYFEPCLIAACAVVNMGNPALYVDKCL